MASGLLATRRKLALPGLARNTIQKRSSVGQNGGFAAPIGIKLRHIGVFRPERPVLLAQAEGLGKRGATPMSALKGPFI